MSGLRSLFAAAAVAGTLLMGAAGGAVAADGSIAHVEPTSDGLQILVSVPPDAVIDLDQVGVTINDTDADAEAVLANSSTLVERTAVLAIDTSRSMRGTRFDAAKEAALAYLDAVPDDVKVGIVSFAADVISSLQPTLDRDLAREVIDQLSLSRETRLYDGVLAAAEMAGDDGQRSLLVLSDGADTSQTAISDVTAAISEHELLVDVVALEQSGPDLKALAKLARAGNGRVISADSSALSEAFSAEADVLARQVLVTAQVPDRESGTQGTIEVTLPSSDGDISASAYTTIQGESEIAPEVVAPERGWSPPDWVMYAGVGAVGLGLVVLLVLLVPAPARPMSIVDRVASYTSSTGAGNEPQAKSEGEPLAHAKEAVAQVLRNNQSLDAKITHRLEGAGSDLKSSEWLLLHVAILVMSGAVGLLIGQGSLAVGLVLMLLGIVGPWFYLGFRKSRRRKKFNAALPDTLQLMSGSLAAGLSLAQSVDTIVREGTEPVATEFKRVMIEARLGVPLETALEGVAERFESKDFEWVVMAINIQRQVGGNLAELLDTVGATMREREYLRRQVASLSAEGRLSAMVLSVLPPGFLLYLLVANREYVMPLFTDVRGLAMLIGATVWLLVGVFWMSKLVKVEV
ncbi:MAG: type II secretion system F family protein [Actinomycetota bacterium]|nr:type II secretion system F family protein [Actinomycetota bacterium]